jgi:hypothetical protein
MTASRVRFGPTSAPSEYAGQIVALSGQRVVASLRNSAGRPLTLNLDLRIDAASGSVAGDIRAVASSASGNG